MRGWRRVDRDELRRAFETSQLCSVDTDVDQLFDTYNVVLHVIADRFAPAHVIRRRPGRPSPARSTDTVVRH